MDNTKTMFDLSSGLPLDGARVRTIAAEFTYNQQYAANAVVLDITYQPLDEDGDEVGDVVNQVYSVGKNWEPTNEGQSVAHTSGKFQTFNDQTNIGRLVHHYLLARGDGDAEAGKAALIAEMEDRGDPSSAGFWVGIEAAMKRVEYPTQKKDSNGNPVMGGTFVIDEFHGFVDEDKTKAKGGAKATGKGGTLAPKADTKAAAKSTSKAAAAATSDDPEELFGAALFAKLQRLARKADNHDKFMDAAFELEDITDKADDKAWTKAAERIIFNSDDDGLFAQARAED